MPVETAIEIYYADRELEACRTKKQFGGPGRVRTVDLFHGHGSALPTAPCAQMKTRPISAEILDACQGAVVFSIHRY
jgi:hypothetical protein